MACRSDLERKGCFATTRWSVVQRAAQGQSTVAARALEALCATYWYPLYAWLRRQGLSRHEAEGALHQFFADRVLNRALFLDAQHGEGRFRNWLLTCLKNHFIDQLSRKGASKTEEPANHVSSLNLQDAETRFLQDAGPHESPDKLYEKAWALTVLAQALERVRQQYDLRGECALFDEMRCFLPGTQAPEPCTEVAARVGKTEAAFKAAVDRLRQEYGRALRAEIGRTVSAGSDVNSELEHLKQALV